MVPLGRNFNWDDINNNKEYNNKYNYYHTAHDQYI